VPTLISAAQNKHKTKTDTNSNDVYADEPPTSPDPAMALTMGLMNAAAQEAGAGVNTSNHIQKRLRQERWRCYPT